MSSGNAPKAADFGCADKDGKARAEEKKRAPDLWTMLYVAKPEQTPAAAHPHQQPQYSFLSKEVVEPQPALDTGEESDIDSMYPNDASDRKDLTQECSELAPRLANANPNRHASISICVRFVFELRSMHMCPIFQIGHIWEIGHKW